MGGRGGGRAETGLRNRGWEGECKGQWGLGWGQRQRVVSVAERECGCKVEWARGQEMRGVVSA